MRYFFLVFTWLFFGAIHGQTTPDSVVVENGLKYGVHQVQKGETLYSLSRTYDVSFITIKQINQNKLSGLSIGDFVRIPISGQNYSSIQPAEKSKEKIEADTKEKVIQSNGEYKVPPGATVYGICTKFDISKEQLYVWNPNILEEGLKAGAIIKVASSGQAESNPQNDKDDDSLLALEAVKSYFQSATNDTLILLQKIDSTVIKDSGYFHLGLMLPFQYAKQKSILTSIKEEKEKERFYKETEVSLHFYNGIQLALDSLKKQGLRVKVFVYDTKADSNEVKKILARKEMTTMDMIIGPLYSQNFLVAAKLAYQKDISIVSPFIRNDEVVKGNSKVVRCMPNFDSKLDKMVEVAFQKYLKDKIIIVYQTKNLSKAKEFERKLIAKSLSIDSAVQVNVVLAEGMYQPMNHLESDTLKRNALFILDNEESFTTRFTSKLHLRANDYNLDVYAMDVLTSFKNIEIAVWDSLQINVVGQLTANMGTIINSATYQDHFDLFYDEPSDYALLGYDIVYGLLLPCRYTNIFSPSYIVGKEYIGNGLHFKFRYGGVQDGIYNNYAKVYSYHDYKFDLIK